MNDLKKEHMKTMNPGTKRNTYRVKKDVLSVAAAEVQREQNDEASGVNCPGLYDDDNCGTQAASGNFCRVGCPAIDVPDARRDEG